MPPKGAQSSVPPRRSGRNTQTEPASRNEEQSTSRTDHATSSTSNSITSYMDPPSLTNVPTQRLDSLRGRGRGRGDGTPAAALKFQPKASARRSKEDRDQQEKAEQRRLQDKAQQQVREARNLAFERGRGRGRANRARAGRGTFNDPARVPSGFLGGPSNEGSSSRGFRYHRGGGTTGRSGSRHATSTGSKQTDGTYIKEEDVAEAYVISDEDEDGGRAPIINVDDLGLLSEDEEGTNPDSEGKDRGSTRLSGRGLRPVRLERRSNLARGLEVNNDATSSLAQSANHKGKNPSEAVTDPSDVMMSKKKSKGKGKDVEAIRAERKWQGVYQDEDDESVTQRVKQEPEEDATMSDDPDADAATHSPIAEGTRTPDDDQPLVNKEVELLKSKTRKPLKTSQQHLKPAVFQSEADRRAWERKAARLAYMVEEFSLAPKETNDGDEPVSDDTEPKDPRGDLAYLFRLPPKLPTLVPPKSSQKGNELKETSRHDPNASNSGPSITEEPQKEPENNNLFFTTETKEGFQGEIGTLTVYESGFSIISWGGMEFETKKEPFSSMLQEVVIVDRDQGITHDIGQVHAELVATPELDWLFEAASS